MKIGRRDVAALVLASGCIFAGGATSATVVNPPSISKAYEFSSIQAGEIDPLTITITNPNVAAALSGVGFTDVLPIDLVVATPPGTTDSCSGTVTATSGTSTISLTGGTIAADSSCQVVVDITGIFGPVSTFNTISFVSSTNGGTGGASNTAELDVVPATTTPEPMSLLLMGSGLLGLAGYLRRK